MKFATLQCLVFGAGLVAATPLRVIMLSSHSEVTTGLRFGMPVAHINPHVAQIVDPMNKITTTPSEAGPQMHKGAMRRPCHSKAIGLSNTFRKILGLPLIEDNPSGSNVHGGMVRILPFVGTPNVMVNTNTEISTPPVIRPLHFLKQKNASFMRRLHFALMALGPWEGRAVAFVLGCGIGVLLRMIWVLVVISYRSVRGETEDPTEYQHVVYEYVDDAEEIFVAPPSYVLADEKHPIEDETTKAPSN
ncbi:hypothetical protein HGRIS_003156 [Hohenbuehelia grisea]|uniref:Uncharacterized protein n=1 Tax=Hohenbuehelia grisea TaxID=104357 RepID=A0ABR3JNV8_9AGAR